jgi:hypothetical protein
MSTEKHKGGAGEGKVPQHENVSFEAQDVRSAPILKFLKYLGVAIVLSYLLTLGILRGLTHYWNSTYLPPPPSRSEAGQALPPEPRLQGMPGHLSDSQHDRRDKWKEDTVANEKFGWVDEKSGIAQIPVADAMKLIVEKGLPALPAAEAEKK